MTGEVYNGEVLPLRAIPGSERSIASFNEAVQRVIDNPSPILPPEEWRHLLVTDTPTDSEPKYEIYPHIPLPYDADNDDKSRMSDGDEPDIVLIDPATGELPGGEREIESFEAAWGAIEALQVRLARKKAKKADRAKNKRKNRNG